MTIKLDNPEMREIFETKFHSNQEEFMKCILSFIQDNKKVVDNYFEKKSKATFEYKKLDPMENYYKLSVDESEKEMSNPFDEVEDSVAFAKKLREESYR